MRRQVLGIFLALVAVLLMACAPQAVPALAPEPTTAAAPVPAPTKPAAPALAVPARPAWEQKWEELVVAARKEGRVMLYTSFGPEQRRIVTEPFTSKYAIPVEVVTGTSGSLVPKISAEQRAGIYSGDVYIGGSTTYIPFEGLLDIPESVLILPDLTEPELIKKTWYFGEIPWANKARTALIGLMSFNEVITFNVNLVKAGEITSYQDLLNPKWKGKMSLLDPRSSSMGLMWFAVALETGDLDVNFMRELATKQELFVTRDTRLQVDWLARGKHSIALGPSTSAYMEFVLVGAPIGRISLGTPFVSGSTSGISMPKNQPHPNAAKLFINWLLSQEGQTFHSQAVGAQSQRLDVPTSHLEPTKVLKPGLKLFRSDNEEFAKKKDSYYIQLAKEILAGK